MNKYEAVWVMQDGDDHKEQFTADAYEILGNGVAMFFKILGEPKIAQINLTPTPGQESPPPKVDIVGTASGFIAIHLIV